MRRQCASPRGSLQTSTFEVKEKGQQPLGVRWVDKEIKTYNAPELFSAPPPIERLKFILRQAAQGKSLYLMRHARWLDEGVPLRQGERALVREVARRGPIARGGAHVGEAETQRPWMARAMPPKSGRGVLVPPLLSRRGHMRNGRGVVFVGTDSFLMEIAKHMEEKLSIKVGIKGQGCQEALRILNRSVRWPPRGIEYEWDHRHAEKIIEELALRPRQKVVTPAVRPGITRPAGRKPSSRPSTRMTTPATPGVKLWHVRSSGIRVVLAM